MSISELATMNPIANERADTDPRAYIEGVVEVGAGVVQYVYICIYNMSILYIDIDIPT